MWFIISHIYRYIASLSESSEFTHYPSSYTNYSSSISIMLWLSQPIFLLFLLSAKLSNTTMSLLSANRTMELEKDSPLKDLQAMLTPEEQEDPANKLFGSQEGPDKARLLEAISASEDLIDEVVEFVPPSDRQHALLPLIYLRLMLGQMV